MKARESLLNLALRGLSMGARFLLIFYLGKYFSLDNLGLYGIFFTTVTLSYFLLGLDFYTYSNREVLYARNEDKLSVLRDQLAFYLVTYTVFLLPLLLVFFYDILPLKYIVFFYFILVFEHLSQELYRVFTMLSYPVFANWLLFLRSGSWIYLIILGWIIMPDKNYSLSVIWWGWMMGSGLSVIIGVIEILRLYKGHGLRRMQFAWFVAGLKISVLYFGSTIALKIIEYSSRYLIEYWWSIKDVGVFTFFSQIANMINVAISTLLIMIIYPKLVHAVNENNVLEFYRLKKYMLKRILFYSIALGVLVSVLIEPMLYFINKNDFYGEVNLFYVLILSNIVFNVGLVYYYVLYAFHRDFSLFVTTAFSGVSNVALNMILIKYFGIMGAAISTLLSYVIFMILNAHVSKKAESFFWAANRGVNSINP